jgi:hypothetical protein
VVDLLEQQHRAGRRFEPTELIEQGPRVAVALRVTDRRWQGTSAEVYKVFTFSEPGGEAMLLQDCSDREDALARLG